MNRDSLPSTDLVRRHLIRKVWQVCHSDSVMVYTRFMEKATVRSQRYHRTKMYDHNGRNVLASKAMKDLEVRYNLIRSSVEKQWFIEALPQATKLRFEFYLQNK
jgi:hypothetical protein